MAVFDVKVAVDVIFIFTNREFLDECRVQIGRVNGVLADIVVDVEAVQVDVGREIRRHLKV